MRRIVWPALALLAIAPACGDDSNSSDDGDPIDAPRVDARIIDATIDSSTADAAVDATELDAAVDAPPTIDAAVDAPPTIDAAVDAAVDAMVDAPPAVTGHLLLTEVKTVGGSEFIEIWNPTTATIDLRNYYLTDMNSYWRLPSSTAITPVASDFVARFPVGATIAPNAVITIATDGVAFIAPTTGFPTVTPTYTIQEPTAGATAMELVVADAGGNPGLTNGGEMVALFFWDGASDLVKDVDLVFAGPAGITGDNQFAAKGAVDGPDADTTTSDYAPDLNTLTPMGAATDGTAPSLKSYKRIANETGREVQTGAGNGITGDDETSEMTVVTWDSRALPAEYTDATPGVIPTIP